MSCLQQEALFLEYIKQTFETIRRESSHMTLLRELVGSKSYLIIRDRSGHFTS